MDRSTLHDDALEAATGRLAGLIERHAPGEGESPCRLPGVRLYRISHKDVEWTSYAGLTPSFCLVPQGAKSSLIGQRVYQYNPAQMAVYTIDVPVSGYATQASRARPLLCFRLDLDPQRIAHHVLDVFPRGIPNTSGTSVVEVTPTDAAIVACACRMLELDQQTDEARLLAPIITDEILIRLLRGPLGTRVAQIGHAESALRRITKSVAWIRTNFTQQINVDTLAALASMSLSTFHHHFKCATGMSPVQFQKSLRLQEAKRLLATTDESAALVSRLVGYASPSQFSREYARQFGAPPSRDPSVSGSSAVAR